MSKKRFVYYQPNKKDLKDKYGDCTVRALAKALGVSWLDAFDLMTPICREYQAPNIFNLPCDKEREAMARLGFDYTGVSNRKGTKRPTVDEFAKAHPTGTYICNVANHEIAVVDGKYYDTWDSGDRKMYGFYTKRETGVKE